MSDKKEVVIFVEPAAVGLNSMADMPVIAVKVGEKGYYPIYTRPNAIPADFNDADVTPEIIEAAVMGSMFGWDCPGAKAANDYAAAKGE